MILYEAYTRDPDTLRIVTSGTPGRRLEERKKHKMRILRILWP